MRVEYDEDERCIGLIGYWVHWVMASHTTCAIRIVDNVQYQARYQVSCSV